MTILLAIGAALAGFAVCWWLQPRLSGHRELLAERDRRELDLRSELERRDSELGVARGELGVALGELAEARAGAAASAARLETLEEKLPETVRSISQETLDASRETFLAQAGERVEKTLLPVHQRLGDLRKLVDETEARRLEDGGRLTAQLELLSAGTRSLAVALGSTQTRGRWGEIQLERILEFVGMEEGVDYSCQTSKQGGRPDVVVHLPGGKNVVIDSKAPFDAFERAAQAAGEEERAAALAEFGRRVRLHVQELGRKGYWAHVTPSPDFTFMFLPGDAYLAAAEEQDAELFSFAYERGVLLTTPRTIVVMLRTIRVAWQNENASDHAQAVLKVASELHERLSTMAEHLAKVGRGLDSAVSAYNKAVGSYGSRVLVSARRLEGLAATRSTLDDLPPLTEHASSQLQPLQLEVVSKSADAA
ncbi:DNA recombination protein RmuC [Gaiella sp.]|jgi:DNA recombination protein RmuC|uniref:DNA recombination protein RmuC n=1 Tax=Gaiella sp. TaxID=2663207 RepID=UPI002B848D68|nr:DNA recombination protein RmuC [Gaiella sp.]HWO79637.1 DNA recombination protein RmuC [Gaiella sp.]